MGSKNHVCLPHVSAPFYKHIKLSKFLRPISFCSVLTRELNCKQLSLLSLWMLPGDSKSQNSDYGSFCQTPSDNFGHLTTASDSNTNPDSSSRPPNLAMTGTDQPDHQ